MNEPGWPDGGAALSGANDPCFDDPAESFRACGPIMSPCGGQCRAPSPSLVSNPGPRLVLHQASDSMMSGTASSTFSITFESYSTHSV